MAEWSMVNSAVGQSTLPDWNQGQLPSAFVLDAAPNTDIYASPLPPIRHVFSAPVIYRRITKGSFQSAQVSVRSRWSLQFDQGGLVFVIPASGNPAPDATTAQTADTHPEWVKVGIEVNDGKAYVSIVAKSRDNWCDWSLVPLPDDAPPLGQDCGATISLTRSKNALMVWMLSGQETMLIRKVPWVFLADGDATEVWVGVYAARPDPDGEAAKTQEQLRVSFEGFDMRWTRE
jgi:regulation of enolase protein 1 (concanavalin A-like superfamily)